MSETKTVKTSLGELQFEKKENHYFMSSDLLYKKMEENGVPDPEKTIKAVYSARDKILQEMAHFTSDKAKETMQDASITAGKLPFRLEAETVIVKEVNVPGRDGAATSRKTVYGNTSAKEATKTPSFIKKDDYLHQNAAEIEKKYNSAKANTIKCA